MPAKHLSRIDQKGTYSHVYNKGVENRLIFNDEHDYNTFVGYLEEYLSDPSSKASKRTSFTVNGKTFQGTPHLPKNYFGKIDLIAYSLATEHFHLILHQKAEGAIQSFIRSICTRYSIYFNKKYERRGSLFEGPYKSAQIKDDITLVELVSYLHQIHQGHSNSSMKDYEGINRREWVNTTIVSNILRNNPSQLGASTYTEFVSKNKASEAKQQLLKDILIEKSQGNLERRDLSTKPNIANSNHIAPKEEIKKTRNLTMHIVLLLLFFGLLDLGFRNIYITTVESKQSVSIATKQVNKPIANAIDSTPMREEKVLSASDNATDSASILEDPNNILYSVVSVKEGSGEINIYNEESTDSEVITTAIDGDTFTALPLNAEWYEIRFTDKNIGFIESKYIKIEQVR